MRIIVVGATGYIGACLLESARQIGDAKGTSSLASPNMLRLSLESPDNFDYKELDTQLVPDKMRFNFKSQTSSEIEVNYSKFSSGKSLSFPFKISSKYVQINK